MVKIAIVYHSETGNTEKMAQLVAEGCEAEEGVEVRLMSVDDVDESYLDSANVLILGCPTYEGSASWQMKRFLDTAPVSLADKLGACFASQNWPGGGGADFAELTLIAAMLVHGMLIYSGGITQGKPFLHFGAVSARAPEGLYAERCRKLGANLTQKAKEIFSE